MWILPKGELSKSDQAMINDYNSFENMGVLECHPTGHLVVFRDGKVQEISKGNSLSGMALCTRRRHECSTKF